MKMSFFSCLSIFGETLLGLPWKFLPEYFVCYATYLLAHYSDFESHEDIKALREIKEYNLLIK